MGKLNEKMKTEDINKDEHKMGIGVAGNIIADIVKNITEYPKPGMLTYVSDVTLSVGGCVPNTAINLAVIDGSIPLSVYGKIGADENGRYIIAQMQKHRIDTKNVLCAADSLTSFCDVMSIPSGERTFFHKKGANAEFSPTDIDITALNCKLFHIGYILLLDQFDKPDPEFGTVMGRFLCDVQKRGIQTSIDVVSDSFADYEKMIVPALRYCNYVIINEIECCKIWGLDPRTQDGHLNRTNIHQAMRKTAEAGVQNMVIVHCKETAFLLNVHSEMITEVSSLKIPKEEIRGSVGAGDAFCAGSLYGIYNAFKDQQILEFASAAAACSLFAANAVDGMKARDEIFSMLDKYGRLSLEA